LLEIVLRLVHVGFLPSFNQRYGNAAREHRPGDVTACDRDVARHEFAVGVGPRRLP
jgi:hypothetical protein